MKASFTLDEIYKQIQELSRRFDEITIVRNAEGVISLFVCPKPEQSLIQELDDKLNQYLGPFWSGTIRPFGKEPSDTALRDFIQAERIIAPWDDPTKTPRWYILERVVSKHAWFLRKGSMPWSFEDVESGKPPIVVFHSFKGGMGRTTAMVFSALALASEGFKVAIVDLDLEAPGLSSFFAGVNAESGLLDYLLAKNILKGKLRASEVAKEIDLREIFMPEEELVSEMFESESEDHGKLVLVPAGRMDSEYLKKLARLDYQFHEGAPVRDALIELFKELEDNYKLDFILLDSRAGFHDLCGLVLNIAHQAVLFGVHSEESWNGLKEVVHFLSRPEDESPCSVVMVHSLSPGRYTPELPSQKIQNEFLQRSYDIFCECYYSEGEVPDQNDSESAHYPIFIQWNPLLLGQINPYAKEIQSIFLSKEEGYSELVERIKLLPGKAI